MYSDPQRNNIIKVSGGLRVNVRQLLLLMILSTLMLANLFMIIGLPADSGSRVIGAAWLVMMFMFVATIPLKSMAIGYKYLLSLLVISIFLGMIKLATSDFTNIDVFLYNLASKSMPKILFLVFIYYLIIGMNQIDISIAMRRYAMLFLLTIGLSLLLYYFMPMNRFVMYGDSRGVRFAALHFELVNFSYTLFTAGIILLFAYVRNKFYLYLGIILLSVVTYQVSLSNYVPIFMFSIVFSIMLLRTPFKSRRIIYLIYFTVLLAMLMLLPAVLEYLEKYLYLFPRSSGTLTDDDPIFIRLYRHIFAMQYFYDNALSLPYGLFNGGIDAALNDIKSWSGGSGLSKVFMDLGLLVIPFAFILVQTCLKALSRINVNNQTDQMFFVLMNLSIVYAYLQAGFFNFTVVSIFLLSIRYWKIV